jgi:hypothetical protein
VKLTYDQAVDELFKAVKERGERFVYPEDWRDDKFVCQYVRGPHAAPACIVGQVYYQLGVDLSPLVGFFGNPLGAASKVGIELGGEAEELLCDVQRLQDDGTPWGEAVSKAIAAMSEDA